MRIIPLFSFVLLLVVSVSCSDPESKYVSEDLKGFSETIIQLDEETNNPQLSKLIKEPPKFIFLETTENSLIAKIDKVIVYGELIFILDSFIAESVLVFDIGGKFIQKLSSRGEGPGQYQKPLDIFIENDQVWMIDNGREIKVFDLKGMLIDNYKLDAFSALKFQKYNDSDFFAFVSGDMEDNLIVADNNLNRIHSYFPYVDREIDMIILNSMFKSYDSGDIIYRRNYNDTLYSIKKDGIIRPYKFINYGNLGIDYQSFLNLKSSDSQNTSSNKYAHTSVYSENLRNEVLAFSYNSEFWISIFDKKNENSILFRYSNYQNDLTFENDFNIIGNTANDFIFQLSPQSIKISQEKILSNSFEGFSPEFFQKIKQLSQDDNPILMLVQFDLSPS